MFRSSGTHELYTKWPRGEARRPRLRVRGGKVFVFELSGTHELHTIVCTVYIFSIVSIGNDVKGSEKRRTPSVFLFKEKSERV